MVSTNCGLKTNYNSRRCLWCGSDLCLSSFPRKQGPSESWRDHSRTYKANRSEQCKRWTIVETGVLLRNLPSGLKHWFPQLPRILIAPIWLPLWELPLPESFPSLQVMPLSHQCGVYWSGHLFHQDTHFCTAIHPSLTLWDWLKSLLRLSALLPLPNPASFSPTQVLTQKILNKLPACKSPPYGKYFF